MGTIVVGYVPTPEGKAAIQRGIEEARLRQTTLVVVGSKRGGEKFGEVDAAAFDQAMDDAEAQLAQSGVSHKVRRLVRGNDPADDLITVAEEEAAELIVIGLRRRSPVGKMLMGSNAQQILLEADCPVLAVKAGG